MRRRIRRDLRLLQAYSLLSFFALVVVAVAAFSPASAQQKFAEISVERLNVVDANGTLRLVISNKDRMHPGVMDGVTINRPPRDGYMAFIRSPDGISIELLQRGEPKAPAEPWTSMQNTGSW